MEFKTFLVIPVRLRDEANLSFLPDRLCKLIEVGLDSAVVPDEFLLRWSDETLPACGSTIALKINGQVVLDLTVQTHSHERSLDKTYGFALVHQSNSDFMDTFFELVALGCLLQSDPELTLAELLHKAGVPTNIEEYQALLPDSGT